MAVFRITFTQGSVIELPLSSSFEDDMYWYLSKADEAELKEILNETTTKTQPKVL